MIKYLDIVLTVCDLYKYRNKVLYTIINDLITTKTCGSTVGFLIKYFSNKKDVNYLYILYDLDSRFATNYKYIHKNCSYTSKNARFIYQYTRQNLNLGIISLNLSIAKIYLFYFHFNKKDVRS